MKFDVRQTNIAKGVALLLLLWHHLFFSSPEVSALYTSLFTISGRQGEAYIADFCKVCVAMFIVLSGYGLFKSYDKGKSKTSSSFLYAPSYVIRHIINLLSDYWFIMIIFVPMGLAFGRKFYILYGNDVFKYLADIFGVSYFAYGFTSTMNESWWFMSIILFFYLIFPILYRLEKISGELLLTISAILLFIVPQFKDFTFWLLAFSIGIYMADKGILDSLGAYYKNKFFVPLITCASAIFFFGYMRVHFFELMGDALFAVPFIILSFTVLSKISVLNTFLEYIGRYSGLIYMFHSFIHCYYFKNFIYSFKYSFLIYFVFLAICYVVAVALTKLKQLLGYDKLFKKICMFFDVDKSTKKDIITQQKV